MAETKYVIPESAYATTSSRWYAMGRCLWMRPTKDMSEIEQRRAMIFPCIADPNISEEFYEGIASALNAQPILKVCTRELFAHVEGRRQMSPNQLKFLKEVTKGLL